MSIRWVAAAAVLAAPATAQVGDPVAAAMTASAAGWNAGDLDRFMAVYAEDAVYVTAKGVVRGRRAIAARYAPSFRAGGNARGRLSFRTLAERPLAPGVRLHVSRWTLSGRTVQSGLTTLVFERRRGAWRIVADHSS